MALIKMKAPEGAEGAVGHRGQNYPIQGGYVTVPEDAAAILRDSHGFVVEGDADAEAVIEPVQAAPEAPPEPEVVIADDAADPDKATGKRKKADADPVSEG